MEAGRITQTGRHEELFEKDGFYKRMFTSGNGEIDG
jgi:ABC-type transport system involved in Fe-S cluster assembly fused permease/ATPase subunit